MYTRTSDVYKLICTIVAGESGPVQVADWSVAASSRDCQQRGLQGRAVPASAVSFPVPRDLLRLTRECLHLPPRPRTGPPGDHRLTGGGQLQYRRDSRHGEGVGQGLVGCGD